MYEERVSVIDSFDELAALIPEWTRLFYESGIRNAFAHPAWMMTWAQHFVPPGCLHVITVRDRTARLIGVAPLYFYVRHWAPGVTASHLRLFGTGLATTLTEMPQILAAPDTARVVMRDLISFLYRQDDWDWADVTLSPGQGWFEPEWITEKAGGSGGFAILSSVRAFPVRALSSTWDEFHSGLKRHAKKSLRASVNRLAQQGHTWEVAIPEDSADFQVALTDLIRLHRGGVGLRARPSHADYLVGPETRAFLQDVGERMFRMGHATPYRLRVDDQIVAARLVLHANQDSFFSIAGFDPAWSSYGVGTLLTGECFREAINRHDSFVNLSTGPNTGKLRWADSLEYCYDFFVVNARRRSRFAFFAFSQFHAAANLRRARRIAAPVRARSNRGSEPRTP